MARVELQPFEKQDFDRLINWVNSEELLIQFAGTQLFYFPLSKKQLAAYLEDINRFAFTVIKKSTQDIIGHAEVYLMDNGSAKLCRILIGDSHNRSKGYGKEIVNLLLAKVKRDLKVSHVHLNVYNWNLGAIRCYEECGFRINTSVVPIESLYQNGVVWKVINMVHSER